MMLNSSFRVIIKQIIETENCNSPIEDDEVIKIELKIVRRSDKIVKYYGSLLVVLSMLYLVKPMLMTPIIVSIGNTTTVMRYLPISSWLPFDKQEHYP
ncbi:hypothetical protein HUJ04_010000, partial [Dendroctonus ponderosae]